MLFDVEATQTTYDLSNPGPVASIFRGQWDGLSINTTRLTQDWENVGHLERHGKKTEWQV